MTELEIREKIDKIADKMFMIQMNDHWSLGDYTEYNALRVEYEKLKTQLPQEGGNETPA